MAKIAKTGFLYKTYNFVDKDPVIDRLRGYTKGIKYSKISADSGVSVTTLRNWFEGQTKRPQYATVIAVMRALGYRESFVQMGVKNEKGSATTRKTRKDVVRGAQI